MCALEEIRSGKCPNNTAYALSHALGAPSGSIFHSDSSSDMSQRLNESEDGKIEEKILTEAIQAMEGDVFGWDTGIFLALHRRFCDENVRNSKTSKKTSTFGGDIDDKTDAVPIRFDLDQWSCLTNEDVVCMECWMKLLRIDPDETLYQPFKSSRSSSDAGANTDTDASSDHDFSPLLFDR